MFRHEGAERSDHHNRLLAGYLATVAGFVNSAGFVLVGSFTSHTTGNVGRFADNMAVGSGVSALSAGVLVGTFFLGAFVASMAIESNVFGRLPFTYGALLAGEATMLLLFLVFFGVSMGGGELADRDPQAAFLCVAMGIQNSLVTRLSGAVVRTTHLTGVVTDLGIEAARWFRYWRARAANRFHVRLALGSAPPSRPHAPKTALLVTIAVAFIVGSAAGAALSIRLRQASLCVPLLAIVCGAVYAFASGRDLVGPESRK